MSNPYDPQQPGQQPHQERPQQPEERDERPEPGSGSQQSGEWPQQQPGGGSQQSGEWPQQQPGGGSQPPGQWPTPQPGGWPSQPGQPGGSQQPGGWPSQPEQPGGWQQPGGWPPQAEQPGGWPQPEQTGGWQQPGGWPQQPGGWGQPPAGYQQWQPPPAERPRRPGVLITAGVLWLLNGAFLLIFGIIMAVADRLPGFEDAMREQGVEVTRDQLLAVGIGSAVFGAALVALAIVVFNGATWARILIMAVAIVPTALLLATVIFPLFTIAASVLQFLPPVTRYVQAKRRWPAPT